MRKPEHGGLAISGLGVTSAIGQGQAAFAEALFEGRHRFGTLRRPGREHPAADGGDAAAPRQPAPPFLGAEIDALRMPATLPDSLLRTASFSAQAALATLHEAWADAGLQDVPPDRIGLVIGGSNVQQRELVRMHDAFRGREQFLRPTYGMTFLDSDLCGLCTQAFGITGYATMVGGASASGQVAVVEALHAVEAGRVDVCIAMGALMDLSHWECQGLRSLGAMGSGRYADDPAAACRPFDRERDGFIYGEACGAIVIERADHARSRGRRPRAGVSGWGMRMDANRNPNPSVEGEVAAIRAALQRAALDPACIDYVNPHGTGSAVGDVIELESLRRCGLAHARLNTTKSIVGHGLSAAGAVELIAVVLQMEAGRLHPSRNLDNPIDASFDWTGPDARPHVIEHALNLSMGFGGINTAVCVQRVS